MTESQLLLLEMWLKSFFERNTSRDLVSPTERAIYRFIVKMTLPPSVKNGSMDVLMSYIRDALKRGTDHWEICSPADVQVSSFADNEDMQ